MDKEGVIQSRFIRHFNLLLTMKFVAIMIIIYFLQNIQTLQILGSLAISLAWLIKCLVVFCKHRVFESKLTKVIRLSQEFCFTLVLVFTGVFYLEYMEKINIHVGTKKVIVYLCIAMVLMNVTMETVLLVKGISQATCCKKKKKSLNKVEPNLE